MLKEYAQLKVQMETSIAQSMLSKYENGELRSTTENLMILADFYNTSLDYLTDLTDETKKYPRKKNKIKSRRAAKELHGDFCHHP